MELFKSVYSLYIE